jgi:hypothetical protein
MLFTQERMNFRLFSKGLFLSGIALLFMGCTQLRIYEGASFDPSKAVLIEEGKTTKSEILRDFGPPQPFAYKKFIVDTAVHRFVPPLHQVQGFNPHKVFTYHYRVSKGFGLFLVFYTYLDLETTSDYLMIFFDDQDKVSQYAFSTEVE